MKTGQQHCTATYLPARAQIVHEGALQFDPPSTHGRHAGGKADALQREGLCTVGGWVGRSVGS